MSLRYWFVLFLCISVGTSLRRALPLRRRLRQLHSLSGQIKESVRAHPVPGHDRSLLQMLSKRERRLRIRLCLGLVRLWRPWQAEDAELAAFQQIPEAWTAYRDSVHHLAILDDALKSEQEIAQLPATMSVTREIETLLPDHPDWGDEFAFLRTAAAAAEADSLLSQWRACSLRLFKTGSAEREARIAPLRREFDAAPVSRLIVTRIERQLDEIEKQPE